MILAGFSDEPSPSPVGRFLLPTPTQTPTPEPMPASTAMPEPRPTPPSIMITGPEIYSNNVFVLPVAENISRQLWDPPLVDYTARFYEYFNDEFDFLVFVANFPHYRLEPGTSHGAFYAGPKNDLKGIGKTIPADCQEWGSTEKLQSVVYINTHDISGGDFVNGVLHHELMHRWANFVVPPCAHWGFISQDCVLDRINIFTMIDHGDGRFSHEFSPNPYVCCPIESYLVSFIAPEEVPDFQIAVDEGWVLDEEGYVIEDDNGYRVFTESGFETYTIDDIIAQHGPQDPDAHHSEKNFRAAVVLLVSADHPATPEILHSLSEDVSWFSHPGGDTLYRYNFYVATGGRGTITMDGLPDFLKDV